MYANCPQDIPTTSIDFNICIDDLKPNYGSNFHGIFYDGTQLPNLTDESSISKLKLYIPIQMYIPFNEKKNENEHSTIYDTTNFIDRINIPKQLISVSEILFFLNFENKLSDLQSNSTIEKTLEFLFETFEDKLLLGEFELCNTFLEFFDVNKFNVTILLGLLTISYPWKKRLFFRENLYKKVQTIVENNFSASEAKDLLWGLE